MKKVETEETLIYFFALYHESHRQVLIQWTQLEQSY